MQISNQQYYNCEVDLSDGTKYRVDANWLHNEQLDHWQGWSCAAGYNRLMIDSNLTVYSGVCLNDCLGNLKNNWEPLKSPTICKLERCTGCTDDLLQYKKEIK